MQSANAETLVAVESCNAKACKLDMVMRQKLGRCAVAYDTGLPRTFLSGGQNGRVNHENL